ncbi:MAG: DUF11 domain-containing protein [Clostridia bacterium]|nr:DUF11 domain-containing protein [bacterium]MBP3630394.1 DUF11 domain-containing protein [Clostridia bacterium]
METITNQASVSYSYEGSTLTRTNNSNIVTHSVRDEHSILVDKTSSSESFRVGQTITYFVKITNNGCSCLGSFEIRDNLGNENHTSYIDRTARLFKNGELTEITPTETSPLQFNVNERLGQDESLYLLYNVMVNENLGEDINELTNEVSVTAYPCGCNCNDNGITVEDSLTIPRSEFAEVQITKYASCDDICCGDEIDYYITLTNTGTIDATNVIVTDQLPSAFTATEIHMDSNGEHYQFSSSEYTIDNANLLTLPNETGRAILVPAISPGVENTTLIRIHGHM